MMIKIRSISTFNSSRSFFANWPNKANKSILLKDKNRCWKSKSKYKL